MATRQELKKIALARLKTAEILMENEDWDMAGYIMGYVLECALKSAICKTLNLPEYLDTARSDRIRSFFQTHDLECLLVVSGLSYIFKLRKRPARVLKNWSDFTFHYGSEWVSTRYKAGFWDEATINKVYTNLTEKPYGILTQLTKNKKW